MATLRPLRNTVTRSETRENVVEEVRDEDEAAARRPQPPQHREQPLDLGRRERRGRLVQNDDPRAGEQHAAELDQLLQAEGQATHARARIDVDAEAAADARRASRAIRRQRRCRAGWSAGVPRKTFSATVSSGTMQSSWCTMPMPAASASRAERKCTGAAVDAHGALIVGMHAGDDLHQRALAGAVLADEAVDLARAQREVDVR